ncbi:MAG TPA: recombinase family protein, partial [Novosphingobium sp.]|nr:recombinase family protein [Novosphingobium sp.]
VGSGVLRPQEAARRMKPVRCAIYTRKSSEEGLEQDFNSLDAQREACSAYIRSQASEGWSECPARYDDGGISGGTLLRPGLQRLLADIAEGSVDIVVVYKVDRLTRSLLDFAKLVERFDTAGISFVSVTQSFNTTTSMGRLTLNMLLSFAQFEREVTAERIRDKIAASKAKGMWMGGTPPLGYIPHGRTLAIDEPQAELVRMLHRRYRELGTVRALADWLTAEGIRTPKRSTSNGKSFGGAVFSRGQLYSILKNPVYVGDIVHHGKVYAGQHFGILPREEWEETQAQLAAHVKGRRTAYQQRAALLAGILIDGEGQRLIPVHSTKGSQQYRYYVSEARHHDGGSTGMRLPAKGIEQLVTQRLAQLCSDPVAMAERLNVAPGVEAWQRLSDKGQLLAANIRAGNREVLAPLLTEVVVTQHNVAITLDAAAMAEALGVTRDADAPPTVTIDVPASLRRSGLALRLVDRAGVAVTPDPQVSLVRLLVQARRYWSMLRGERITIGALAAREGVTSSYLTRVVRLAFLAPAVVESIVEGRQGAELTMVRLFDVGGTTEWVEQEKLLALQ